MKHLTRKALSAALLLLSSALLPACSSGGSRPDDGTPREMKYLDASAYDRWIYVSLRKGSVVEVTDPAGDLSWDIAFHRNDIRINGPEGFTKGKGAAAQSSAKELDEVTSLRGLNFVGNSIAKVKVGFELGSFESSYKEDYVLRDKTDRRAFRTHILRDDFLSNPGVIDKMYDLQDRVLVVRTADGAECYKVKFTGFKTNKGGSGGVSFRYLLLGK